MDIVREIAIEFADSKYRSFDNVQDFVDEVETESYRHRNPKDQINFISSVIGFVQDEYDKHYKDCSNRKHCQELKDHARAIYYLKGLLEEYDSPQNKSDSFSESEKRDFDNKIDRIIEDLDKLKMGQELTYNDIYEELEELKKLYFLGKKNWKQLLAGKTIEMIAGGIISETVSKQLIELTEITLKNLLK